MHVREVYGFSPLLNNEENEFLLRDVCLVFLALDWSIHMIFFTQSAAVWTELLTQRGIRIVDDAEFSLVVI